MAVNKKLVLGYQSDISYLRNASEFVQYFKIKVKHLDSIKHVSILAGHYQIIFDESSKSLVPLIPEEYPAGSDLEEKSKLYAGFYPLRSFDLGLNLLQELWSENRPSQILLLVNDRNIKKGGQLDNNFNADAMANLRREYYFQKDPVPSAFKNICKKYNISISNAFLVNKDAKNTKNGILPKNTIFFSEQVLMRRFKNYTLRKRLEEKEFIITENDGFKNIIYQTSSPNSNDYCILGAKQSTCISVAIELISLIVEMGSSHIILAIPNDCLAPINEAAEIVLSIYQKNITIFVLSNLDTNRENASMKCTIHKFLIKHETHTPEY